MNSSHPTSSAWQSNAGQVQEADDRSSNSEVSNASCHVVLEMCKAQLTWEVLSMTTPVNSHDVCHTLVLADNHSFTLLKRFSCQPVLGVAAGCRLCLISPRSNEKVLLICSALTNKQGVKRTGTIVTLHWSVRLGTAWTLSAMPEAQLA